MKNQKMNKCKCPSCLYEKYKIFINEIERTEKLLPSYDRYEYASIMDESYNLSNNQRDINIFPMLMSVIYVRLGRKDCEKIFESYTKWYEKIGKNRFFLYDHDITYMQNEFIEYLNGI